VDAKVQPTRLEITARTIDDRGYWVEGMLRLWVNEDGDVHVHSWLPTRVCGERQEPGPATVFGKAP
jgi:hypothetical protein